MWTAVTVTTVVIFVFQLQPVAGSSIGHSVCWSVDPQTFPYWRWGQECVWVCLCSCHLAKRRCGSESGLFFPTSRWIHRLSLGFMKRLVMSQRMADDMLLPIGKKRQCMNACAYMVAATANLHIFSQRANLSLCISLKGLTVSFTQLMLPYGY